MSIFLKLFDTPKEHNIKKKIKKILTEAQKETSKKYKPIGEIVMAIVKASTNSRDAVKNLIQAPTEKERLKCEIHIFYEFIYFYMHMTMRSAFGQLTEPEIEKLQEYLGPLISSVAIDSYCAHWPDDLKQKMTNEFYDKLNEAELEYTTCTQSDPTEQGEKQPRKKLEALFMKLGSNISSLSGNGEKSLGIIVHVSELAINELTRMELNKLIVKLKKSNYMSLPPFSDIEETLKEALKKHGV